MKLGQSCSSASIQERHHLFTTHRMVVKPDGMDEIQACLHERAAPIGDERSNINLIIFSSFTSIFLSSSTLSIPSSMTTLLLHHLILGSSIQMLGRSYTLDWWPCSLPAVCHHSSCLTYSRVLRTNFAIVEAIYFHDYCLQACFLDLSLLQPWSPHYTQVPRALTWHLIEMSFPLLSCSQLTNLHSYPPHPQTLNGL